MRGVLAEIGYADALLTYQTEEGLTLVDGHLRASLDPDQMVPVLILDIDEAEANKLLATLDPLAGMAIADAAAFGELVSDITFDAPSVNEMISSVAANAPAVSPSPLPPSPEDEADERRTAALGNTVAQDDYKPFTKRGQVWQLGRHRLMCGDSTNIADHETLLADATIDLVVTDPPYGVGVEYGEFQDTPENVLHLIADVVPLCRKWPVTLITSGHQMLWDYPRPTWLLGWVHPAGMGLNKWGFTYFNPILAYGKDPYLAAGLGSRSDTLVLAAGREGIADHPTPKPLAVWEWLIRRGTIKARARILDPFLGSGTTLIACEKLGHICYGIEIEPNYCDVIIKRWEQYTGRKAKLVEGPSP